MTGGKTLNLVLKIFLKNFFWEFNKILEFQYWKEDCEGYTKRKTSTQKLKRWLKTYKMNFLNQKTNKQYQVLNFVLTN